MDDQTRPDLANNLAGLSHELHNILTVLFGIADALEGDQSEVARENAPLLQASVSRIEEVAGSMTSVGSRMLDGLTVRPHPIATELAQAARVPELSGAFGEAVWLQAEPSVVERLILSIAVVASQSGGLTEVTPLHVPDRGSPGHDVRLGLRFGGSVTDAGAALVASAVRDLGGALSHAGSSLQCDLIGGLGNAPAAD